MSLEKIKQTIKKFEDTQSKFQANGACDTEPDGVFQDLIARTMQGKPCNIPNTRDGWQLYDNKGSSNAAKRLHTAAKRVCNTISNCTIKQRAEVEDYLRGYCWRA